MTGPAAADGVTEDRLLNGRVRLRQPAAGYRAAIDPVFLAAAVPLHPRAGTRCAVLDLGCGVGAAALCLLARHAEAEVIGLEIQPRLAALARENAALNGCAPRFRVVDGDLTEPGILDACGAFDEVLCNPPHHPAEMEAAPDPAKATATRESGVRLDDWADAALTHCRPGGAVTFIHRADRLGDLLGALRGPSGDRSGGIVVFPLWPKSGRPARRVVVRARKGLRAPLTLAPGLVLHDDDGRFTPEAERVLRAGQGLAL